MSWRGTQDVAGGRRADRREAADTAILAGLLRDVRVRLPGILLAMILLALSLERALILLAMRERFAEAAPGTLARAFLVGLRFDLSIGCFLVALPTLLLLLAPARLRSARWLLRALRQRLGREGRAVLQVAVRLFNDERYNLGPRKGP